MADRVDIGTEFGKLVRRALAVALVMVCIVLFALWRADNPRIERMRMALADWALPSIEITSKPLASGADMVKDFENFTRVYEQNKALRQEIQRLRSWREAAQQLERENAQLRALNNLKLSERVSYVAGEVIADSGSPFSQSVLINIGALDGVRARFRDSGFDVRELIVGLVLSDPFVYRVADQDSLGEVGP